MRTETRHEALQRQMTREEVESYVYWKALVAVGMAHGYRSWAQTPLRSDWVAEWIYQLWRCTGRGANLN
jgi:hypothetical protein